MADKTHPLEVIDRLTETERTITTILLKQTQGARLIDIANSLPGNPSPPTVSRITRNMIDRGVIAKSGSTRNAQLFLSPEIRKWMTAWRKRPAVRYDPTRIQNYRPNLDQWLTPEDAARMRSVAAIPENFAGTIPARAAETFLIDLSWASATLEGSTYSRLDTENLILYGQRTQTANPDDTNIILGHKRAIQHILDFAAGGEPITDSTIRTIHGMLMIGLLGNAALGTTRGFDVSVGGTAYRPASDRKTLDRGLAEIAYRANQIEDPAEASFFLLSSTSYLQAFEDGNKRTGRLLCNIPLLRAGLPPMSFVDVNKKRYLWGLSSFYEEGDPTLLSNEIANGFSSAAPLYMDSLNAIAASHIERKHPQLLRETVQEAARLLETQAGNGENVALQAVKQMELDNRLNAMNDTERAALPELVDQILNGMTEPQKAIWGIKPATGKTGLKERNTRPG